MCDHNLVNDRFLEINCEWKRHFSLRIQEDGASSQDVSLGTVGSLDLTINYIAFPSIPENLGVFVRYFWKLVLAVKKDENVIAKHRQEIAQLMAVILERIWITPKLKKGALTEFCKHSLCFCHAR